MVASQSYRLRQRALPAMVVFFYRNLLSISSEEVSQVMEALIHCLSDQNVEVRDTAAKMLSGVIRCSQRQNISGLKVRAQTLSCKSQVYVDLAIQTRFMNTAKRTSLPSRSDPSYPDKLRKLHSGVLGLSALIESFPYSVEPWMPPLMEGMSYYSSNS